MSDTEFERASRIFGNDLKAAELLARALNPELILGNKPHDKPTPSASIVDLRRRYDIAVNRMPTLFRMEAWEAYDRVTFDADPGSRWNITGKGSSSCEAVSDLLAQLSAEFAKGDVA